MKKWYESKTLWVNFIALIAVVVQGITGKEYLNLESQGVILTLINMILRFITKHEINWDGEEEKDV
jgi:hypothetical protein